MIPLCALPAGLISVAVYLLLFGRPVGWQGLYIGLWVLISMMNARNGLLTGFFVPKKSPEPIHLLNDPALPQ